MENRIITVVSTKTQAKKQINTNATTLAELKDAMRANGINYEGMTFYEGVAKVELTDDASVLPHDVPYKGSTTNNLVIMLTDPNKKIKSGVETRGEAYAFIRENNLQSAIVEKFGRNYTQVSTVELINFIAEVTAPKNCECECNSVKEVLAELIHTLFDYDVLLEDAHNTMINKLEGDNTAIYSDKEIADMMPR